jgi:cytidylate kinase
MTHNSSPRVTIAIDGFSSCGKSTLAKAMAKELHYIFIDSGAMYRAVTLFCFRRGWVSRNNIDTESIIGGLEQVELHFERNAERKLEIFLNGENVEKDIRTLEISSLVSQVSAIREVRVKLVTEQRRMGQKGGVVMDGRDIGSVVFPQADLKLFVTARPEVRAERRFLELRATDPEVTMDEVRKNLSERDHLDSTRQESPLIQTPDAIVLDNSDMTPEEQLEFALNQVNSLLHL